MTLFIACLIIYQFDMDPWLYAAGAALWIVQVAKDLRRYEMRTKNLEQIHASVVELRNKSLKQ